MLRIACFVSGSGSDMQSIIDAIENKEITNGEIALVIASNPSAHALERAKKYNIDGKVFEKKAYPNIDMLFDVIIETLEEYKIDIIVLAGYLTILNKDIVHKYKGRIINIHPSLIPKYCGDGYYGMNVHKAVIENKEKKSGATVHFVDEGVDTGKIILQEVVEVYADDTAETLQKRVLALEHTLLPKAIKKVLNEYKLK